ncbi:MAG: ABC transporter substrate-binding protein [Chloroflexi bacterium]|nr:ABC transporter substrate-binding protein [Chloroflexota bacterium]
MWNAVANREEVSGRRGEGVKKPRLFTFSPLHLFTSSPFHLFILSFLILLTTGCASVDPVLKIGLVGPFEGENRAIGYDVIYSARLAVREINAAGGIGGYRVSLAAMDDSGDPDLARGAAKSLAIDPAIVAVIGHWGKTTAVAAPIYAAANLPFIPAGEPPIGLYDPALLPADFTQAYEAVTPFDETAGPYAASTYDAFELLFAALELAANEGDVNRTAVTQALDGLTHEGLTGSVRQTSDFFKKSDVSD